MRKFTFIADYKGGIFISQHQAENLGTALFLWIDNLCVKEFTEKEKNKIREKFSYEDFAPVPVDEVDNVWSCGAITGRRHYLLLTIVETV